MVLQMSVYVRYSSYLTAIRHSSSQILFVNLKKITRLLSLFGLGSRSGLIQWVEGAMPIFALYKRWQLRKHIHLYI